VSSYIQLRAGDAVGGAVYRITVRQLEALVRLSEAHARIRCSAVIEPRDVREVIYSRSYSHVLHITTVYSFLLHAAFFNCSHTLLTQFWSQTCLWST